MALTLGRIANLCGDAGRLNWVGARSPALIEKSLGYEAGRLSAGYFIALLKEPIRPNQVRFGGITLRSGGREGLPLADPDEDKKRKHNHDAMLEEYGRGGVEKMLAKLANDPRNLSGDERIVKILPVTRHAGSNPAREYPPGGGGGQFTLTAGHDFLIAVEVSPNAIAMTAELWSVSVATDAPYDGRAKLMRYLRDA